MDVEAKPLNIFDYSGYKAYLRDRLPTVGSSRGIRARLAATLGCQPAFISQVLQADGHFSLEHILEVGRFLELSAEESPFLLLLLQKDRAGTLSLRKYFQAEIDRSLAARRNIKERLNIKNQDSELMRGTYYSSWLYSAVHVMTSVPTLQTARSIAEYLGLPLFRIEACLNFLHQFGLVQEKDGRYEITSKRIHIEANSPFTSVHHSNWRLQAIQSLHEAKDEDMHYSSVISLSEDDAHVIKEIFLRALDQQEKILGPSKEEAVYSLSIDFFRL